MGVVHNKDEVLHDQHGWTTIEVTKTDIEELHRSFPAFACYGRRIESITFIFATASLGGTATSESLIIASANSSAWTVY
jgi:hypothetical protein